MSMTKLERVLAEGLAKATNVDIPAIIEAARECCIGGPDTVQTVQTTPVTKVETPAPEAEKPKATRARKTEAIPPPPAAFEQAPEAPKPPEPPAAKPQEEAASSGLVLTGLIEGTGAQKRVVKEVFLSLLEKAKGDHAKLLAINDICDCGLPKDDFAAPETSPVLYRRLTRWGMMLT